MKKSETVGARFSSAESARWAEVVRRVQRRNKLARPSDVLRDLVFCDLNLVTAAERRYLQGAGRDLDLTADQLDNGFLESAFGDVFRQYQTASDENQRLALELLDFLQDKLQKRA